MIVSPFFLLAISGLIGLVMSLVMLVLYRTYPRTISGIRDWFWSSVFATVAASLLLGRGVLPDWLTIVVANTFVLISLVFLYVGLRRYIDGEAKIPVGWLTVFVLSYAGLFSVFTFVVDRVDVRLFAMCVYSIVISTVSVWLSLKYLPKTAGRIVMVGTLVVILLTRLYRLSVLLLGGESDLHLFQPSAPQMILLGSAAVTIPLVTVACIMLASEKLRARLEFMSRYDELTGCLNKATGVVEAEREIARARRRNQKLSLMIIDIDRFKQINDTAGHLAGDRVLSDFAFRVQQLLRQTDQLSRFGGDEFVVILPDTDLEQARLVSDRIHASGRERGAEGWTCSIGLTEWRGGEESFDALLARADIGLYRAKDLGRDQTQAA